MAITKFAKGATFNIRLKDAEGNILHPETVASLVLTDDSHLFVTSTEKTEWNGKFSVVRVAELPEFASAKNNVLYVLNGLVYIKGDSALEVIGGRESTITTKEVANGTNHQTTLAEIQSPKHGDIAIIIELIAADKKQYTSYVYNKNAWTAMDGNYNAENVYFDQDLITTTAIGNITLNNGQATITAAGKNLKQVFDTIFVKEKNPTITQPSVNLTFDQAKAYEVGTKVTPTFSASLNPGSYQYGPATGVTATSWSVVDSASNPAVSAASGSFPELTVSDGMNYTITATAQHTEGAIPLTNVGNEYAAGKISAGSKNKTSGSITGFRAWFVGSNTTGATIDNSAAIRALSNKGAARAQADVAYSFGDGTKVVVIAVPATLKVTAVKDEGAFGTDIFSAFVKSTIPVEGVSGYSSTNYSVYTYKPAAALGKNTYKITIAKA